MRTLRFIVEGQRIRPDPDCDFSGLVPGSNGYLWAEFSFSSEWKNTSKVAAFWSAMGKEYQPQALIGGKTCRIPAEALEKKIFKIQVMGKSPDTKLITNKVVINQNGDKS